MKNAIHSTLLLVSAAYFIFYFEICIFSMMTQVPKRDFVLFTIFFVLTIAYVGTFAAVNFKRK